MVEGNKAARVVFDEAIEHVSPSDEHCNEADGFEKFVFAIKDNIYLRQRVHAFGKRDRNEQAKRERYLVEDAETVDEQFVPKADHLDEIGVWRSEV